MDGATLPLYEGAAQASLRQYSADASTSTPRPASRDYRFAQLIDHVDLYWALTRPTLSARPPRGATPVPADRPLIVVSFHYGQGLFALRWLRAQGRPPRFVSVPSTREAPGALVEFLYGRLRIRVVERLAGAPPIFLGGARRTIEAAMQEGSGVRADRRAGRRRGRLPAKRCCSGAGAMADGLLELAQGTGAQVLVLTAHANADGERASADAVGRSPSSPSRASPLCWSAGCARRRAAWHFWHLWRASSRSPHDLPPARRPRGDDSLAKLARWIAPGATVLELGAATGYFTEHLRAQGCTVDVVEVDPEAASEAARYARRTVVADLDGADWIAQVGDERYDAIVCADVLEHLRDGAGLLRRLVPLLATGGDLLVSVPNVAHSAIIAGLIDERFDYGGEGLLDPDPLRLYTWRSLQAALHEAGCGSRRGTRRRCRRSRPSSACAPRRSRRRCARRSSTPARARCTSGSRAPSWAGRAGARPGRVAAAATVPVRLLHAPSRATHAGTRAGRAAADRGGPDGADLDAAGRHDGPAPAPRGP